MDWFSCSDKVFLAVIDENSKIVILADFFGILRENSYSIAIILLNFRCKTSRKVSSRS